MSDCQYRREYRGNVRGLVSDGSETTADAYVIAPAIEAVANDVHADDLAAKNRRLAARNRRLTASNRSSTSVTIPDQW